MSTITPVPLHVARAVRKQAHLRAEHRRMLAILREIRDTGSIWRLVDGRAALDPALWERVLRVTGESER